jgi:uncharacterized paraquat-inducible protein A
MQISVRQRTLLAAEVLARLSARASNASTDGFIFCNLCHHQHEKSENYCAQCHSNFDFKVP